MGSINIFKPLSTFLQAVPLINPSNIDNFLLWKKLGMLGIEPGAEAIKLITVLFILWSMFVRKQNS